LALCFCLPPSCLSYPLMLYLPVSLSLSLSGALLPCLSVFPSLYLCISLSGVPGLACGKMPRCLSNCTAKRERERLFLARVAAIQTVRLRKERLWEECMFWIMPDVSSNCSARICWARLTKPIFKASHPYLTRSRSLFFVNSTK
jgi:hypothetical protein